MKKLILVRHAKSSWEYDVIDHKRPLKKRGANDAMLVANELKSYNLHINKVLVSDANRTKQTAEIILPVLGIDEKLVNFHHKLYDFSGHDLIEVIKGCEDTINSLMVFGHNHAITAFVNSYGNQYIDNVPTCGVVCIEFKSSKWCDIDNGNTKFTIFPRDFKS